MKYILIDTSYLIFYRYFALIQWWKHAKPDIQLPTNPFECEEFVMKFRKTMKDSITNIKRKLKLNKENCYIISARDCSRKEIWRNKFYNSYKKSREKDEQQFMGGDFFKLVYNNNNQMLYDIGIHTVVQFNQLEADDIIAILKNHIRNLNDKTDIYIITNDHDYLQLIDDNTHIYNLRFQNLKENKKCFRDPEKNLFNKIVTGDKSDSISPVLKRCSVKMLDYYYENKDEFHEILIKNNLLEKFNSNKKIISFHEIPHELIIQLIKENKELFNFIV